MSKTVAPGGIAGVLHVHTAYSDGEFAPEELRRALLEDGCRFVCLTDHAEAFDATKLAAFRCECKRLSDDQFLMVPGLEFECEGRLHLLGFGCAELLDSRDPERVIQHILGHGGVVVLAHPLEEHLGLLERFVPSLNGIEAWNSKYDGRYAPRLTPFDSVRQLRAAGHEFHSYFGLDLHWRTQFRGLQVRVIAPLVTEKLLSCLRSGEFVGCYRDLELSSNGELAAATRVRWAFRHQASDHLRRFLRGGRRLAARLGIRVPTPLKSQLRRIM